MISRVVALPGLLCMLALGRGLLAGSLTMAAAGGRAAALMAVLWLVDRLVKPLVAEILLPQRRRRSDEAAGPAAPSARASR